MKITVAIPCYNGADFLGRTLESVLTQTWAAHQILVVDDGSTDHSREVAYRYPVTVLEHASNQGLATARNTALAAATGEVLLYIDADASAAPDLLEQVVRGYAVGGADVSGVGGQGIEVNVLTIADRWRRAHASQGYGNRPRLVPFLYGLCMSYRVEVLRWVGGFNPAYRANAEDIDLGLRLTYAGKRLLYWPEARVFHQRQDNIASLRRTMANWYRAAYRAKRINRARPQTLLLGTLRRLVGDPLLDLFLWRDPALVPLSLSLNWLKLWVLIWAALTDT
ncbi:MAG: glycosyltransferase [Thermoflexales bacterium]|nr:glycosyltransferase [Thermoflexales bacterium]